MTRHGEAGGAGPRAGAARPRTPQQLAEACAAAMWAEDQASQGLGMRIARVAPGEAEVTMTVEPRMANGHGIGHGGFVFTLADSAFAFACNSFNRRTVAQSNSITYLRPARVGQVLTARAARVAEAGRSGVYDVLVTDESGAAIASFRGLSRSIEGQLVAEEDMP
ncbi:hydroxyphenylacetyl-CoA thioesterase PaaI [Paracraurococcus lichenis]|uniref:Hydroxyphenylacetyl-CoA thioesterase PaaI n=1 Tax=Paracraurococcus lichenis TaxID=3064888 RepID=A0ABT9DW64_9PROT|nr:hydroxyphenylacetyl-CoA thioesterase PaaI [Paracraurococcus sp. LOR1-02]MDO9708147.1 hydroxyphenylacetyl-CoA thioesterase PaaI [Paracraurococcus sp. LOR1-02]